MGAPAVCHGRFAPRHEVEQSAALLDRLARIRPETRGLHIDPDGTGSRITTLRGRSSTGALRLRVESQELEIVLHDGAIATHRLRIPWTANAGMPEDRAAAVRAIAGHARSAARMLRTSLDVPVGGTRSREIDLVHQASIIAAIAGLDVETAALRIPSPWTPSCVVRREPGLRVEGETSLNLDAIRIARTIMPRGFFVSRDDRDSFLPIRIVLAPTTVKPIPVDPMETMRVALKHGCQIPMGERPIPMGEEGIPMGERP